MWSSTDVSLKTSSSGALSAWYDVIPLNPRTHPVKVLVVRPVYVITSSSIFKRPYCLGKPFVLSTFIVLLVVVIPAESDVWPAITSVVKLSNFKYWSRLSTMSILPPWNSCET